MNRIYKRHLDGKIEFLGLVFLKQSQYEELISNSISYSTIILDYSYYNSYGL